MRSLAQTWIKEGEKRGEQRGAVKIVLYQLQHRFGALGAELKAHIRDLAPKQLETLSAAQLFFSTKDDLLAWLQTHPAKPSTH